MAYALGPVGPDERHERIFVRRRSRRAVVLILLAGFVMALSAGGLLALYRSTMHSGAEDVPLLRADNQPTRKRPDDPGGVQLPGQGTMVLDHGRGEPGVEQLLPPPETPLPRPVATEPQVLPQTPSPALPPQSTAPPAAPVVASPAAPAPTAPAQPAPAVAVAPAPPPPAAKPAQAAPPPQSAALPPASAGKGFHLQIGAVRSPEGAKTEWERLKRANGDVLGALGYETRRVDLGERGIYYRIQAGPIADAAAAERDCSELKRRGVGCILVKP